VVKQLREKGAGDIYVIGGGIIPEDDIPKLEEGGIKKVFLPGTSITEIVDWTNKNVKPVSSIAYPRRK